MEVILAVGLEIDFINVLDIIKKETPDVNITTTKVNSGLYYNKHVNRIPHDCQKNNVSLQQWFNKNKTSEDNRVFIRNIHITLDNKLIVGEVQYKNTMIYSFFYNEKNVSTTHIKTEINAGHSRYKKISFDRVTLTCRPYLHKIEDGRHNYIL